MPTKHNPITVTVYGQMCSSAKSYQSAICTLHVLFLCGKTILIQM
jgi:hypothetical protein